MLPENLTAEQKDFYNKIEATIASSFIDILYISPNYNFAEILKELPIKDEWVEKYYNDLLVAKKEEYINEYINILSQDIIFIQSEKYNNSLPIVAKYLGGIYSNSQHNMIINSIVGQDKSILANLEEPILKEALSNLLKFFSVAESVKGFEDYQKESEYIKNTLLSKRFEIAEYLNLIKDEIQILKKDFDPGTKLVFDNSVKIIGNIGYNSEIIVYDGVAEIIGNIGNHVKIVNITKTGNAEIEPDHNFYGISINGTIGNNFNLQSCSDIIVNGEPYINNHKGSLNNLILNPVQLPTTTWVETVSKTFGNFLSIK